jgi:hypothetical protein
MRKALVVAQAFGNRLTYSIFRAHVSSAYYQWGETDCMATKARTTKRKAWTKAHHAELRKHSKARTPVVKIAKAMKRTIGALRQQALKLGIGLGHQR